MQILIVLLGLADSHDQQEAFQASACEGRSTMVTVLYYLFTEIVHMGKIR